MYYNLILYNYNYKYIKTYIIIINFINLSNHIASYTKGCLGSYFLFLYNILYPQ